MAFFVLRQSWVHVFTTGLIGGVSFLSLFLVRRGKTQFAVMIVLSSAYGACVVGIMAERGINDIGLQGIYPIILAIGVLMTRKYLVIFSGLTVGWVCLLVYLEIGSYYIDAPDQYDPYTKGLITIALFLLMVMILRYSVQRTFLMNNELIRAKNEAEESNALKSLFLANMSHELRTPLNAIIGYSEGLIEEHAEQPHLEEFALEDIDRIRISGKHLLTLINDILDLSKIEADKMELFIQPFNLIDLIHDVTLTMQPMLEANQNSLVIHNPTSKLNIISDEQKIKQVLLNLISNAVKYTENGSIAISTTLLADHVQIAIQDSGIGIPAEELPHIFESFRQVDSSLSRSFSGTGLGLAITKNITTLLNGTLTVCSTVGQGSTFTVTLPLMIDPPKTIASNRIKSLSN